MTTVAVPEDVKGSAVAGVPRPTIRRRGTHKVDLLLERTNTCTDLPDEETQSTRAIALARCDCLMVRYLKAKHENLRRSEWSQRVALVLSAVTPVLLLVNWGAGSESTSRLVAAAAAATAAIATGFLAQSGWRENFIRYGFAWHALQGEKYKYLTHATPDYATGNEEQEARTFARRIEEIAMADFNEWRNLMERVSDVKAGSGGSDPKLALDSETR